jgi:Sec-independent protein secretion pathway component TatC
MDSILGGVDALWALVPARYAEDFEYVLGTTPFSSLEFVLGALVAYVVVMYGLRYAVPFAPMKLPRLLALHNALLCAASLVMFVGALLEVARQLRVRTPFFRASLPSFSPS